MEIPLPQRVKRDMLSRRSNRGLAEKQEIDRTRKPGSDSRRGTGGLLDLHVKGQAGARVGLLVADFHLLELPLSGDLLKSLWLENLQ